MPLMKSWIDSANFADCPFPLNNLPFGIMSRKDRDGRRCAVAIGDHALDLASLGETGFFGSQDVASAFTEEVLNGFLKLGRPVWLTVRKQLQDALSADASDMLRQTLGECLVPLGDVTMHLPLNITGYSDFFAGYHHAVNTGKIIRGTESLPPNWLHMPIAYNGRTSTIVTSGTPVRRPLGQTRTGEEAPRFQPCQTLDFELEMAAVVGRGSELGEPIAPEDAEDMIFGYTLLNDWSARDIQRWEYQPLGPFLGKAFATTMSPWIVMKEALEPFRRDVDPPKSPLLPYLAGYGSVYDIELAVDLKPSGRDQYETIATSNHKYLYYSAAQALVHHAIGGCRMDEGDILGSGTISGPRPEQYGSLLELSWGGTKPLKLSSGDERSYLEDGDSLVLTGNAKGDGYTIGFGTCEGTIMPSPQSVGRSVHWS
ncbi:MAG: fumarylacetoacetase [Rhizobiales bacterium]|nr:fumarylacetoacetase [Hyphomicrobiales bacterium]MBA68318.1 fumarylacetoacetase [Hyphomicrobiales bacterium]|tara:strand:+ start:1473 stop:2753 length:1281 start_codon:yes stop_codon:yes gene_type:complete